MQFSVIIPTCNRNDLLGICLDKLAPTEQTIGAEKYEVIVTDDGTNNAAKGFLEQQYPWVKWVEGPKRGPAANRNNGSKYANGDWLVFIDDDCEPQADLLSEYQKALLANNDIPVFEGCIKANREKRSFLEESPINETGGFLWSCNFMISASLFKSLQGFDEGFPFAAMEDVELHYRIAKRNITIVFLENAIVIHPWRIQKQLYSMTLKRFKSTLYFLKKHPEKRQVINSRYYLIAFANGFFKDTLVNAFKYRFNGFFSKILRDSVHIYFSIWFTMINKNKY